MSRSWSLTEAEALVADYCDMLVRELRGERYNKAARNKVLQALTGRSHGSIERKHQNVSAILRELGYRFVDGYKPLGNYQELLYEVVVARVRHDRSLALALLRAAQENPAEPPVRGILDRLVSAPQGTANAPRSVREGGAARRFEAPVDYVAVEARNTALGEQGELWVVEFERARLRKAGKERLAEQIEHVAATEGPRAGFDVRSFEANGGDRLIEVKTTGGPIGMPFFVSPHELSTSRKRASEYHLYRAFDFNRNARLFILRGELDRVCRLEASEFRAEVA